MTDIDRRMTLTLVVAHAGCLQIVGLATPWAHSDGSPRISPGDYHAWTLPDVVGFGFLPWLTVGVVVWGVVAAVRPTKESTGLACVLALLTLSLDGAFIATFDDWRATLALGLVFSMIGSAMSATIFATQFRQAP